MNARTTPGVFRSGRFIKTVLGIVFGILFCCLLAATQAEQGISRALVRHTLILRNFYTGQKLKFDINGALLSGGTPGFAPSDGRIYVKDVQHEANGLAIRGERPISLFNPATGEATLLGLHQKVEVEVALPANQPWSEVSSAILDRIFLSSSEMNALTCSADEARIFRERMLRSKDFISANGNRKKPRDEPRQLCFPDGARAYVAVDGVEPPKPLKTSDPGYPAAAFGTHKSQIVVLGLIVDPDGKPSSLVVIGPSPTIFDVAAVEAVQQWRFHPATYQGKPVPAAINVEVSFHPR